MNINANIETAESVREKAKAALGLDLSSALDLVSRSDYDSEEAYLDAATKAELERSNPEYRSIQDTIKRHMDAEGVDTISGTDWRVTYKAVTSARLDTAALKKALPDLAAQFTKTTTARRFCVA